MACCKVRSQLWLIRLVLCKAWSLKSLRTQLHHKRHFWTKALFKSLKLLSCQTYWTTPPFKTQLEITFISLAKDPLWTKVFMGIHLTLSCSRDSTISETPSKTMTQEKRQSTLESKLSENVTKEFLNCGRQIRTSLRFMKLLPICKLKRTTRTRSQANSTRC